MIGRSDRLRQVQDSLEKSRAGQLQVLFVAGPAGMGKSTLIQASVRNGPFFVLSYHYFERTAYPYAPFVQALREIHAGFPLTPADLTLYPHLGLLLPELKTAPVDTHKGQLTDAIGEVLLAVARQKPLVLVVEDCHWADEATLEILPSLLGRLSNAPITVLITYRDDAVLRDHPLIRLRTQLRRQLRLTEISLLPFRPDETRQLIEEVLGEPPSPGLSDLIFTQTQGLPFFVRELALALRQKKLLVQTAEGLVLENHQQIPIPETIRDMVALQLDGIPEKNRETLELAALVGQEFSLDLISELSGDDQAIDQLVAQSILIFKDQQTGAFSHALVREVIRQDILWSRRKHLNRSIALALEQRETASEVVGQFWLEAGEKGRSRQSFADAARQYCRLYAHADAARTAHKALELWPKGHEEGHRLALLQQLAQCARMGGQTHHSILALREILESPLVQDDAIKQGETYRALAISYALQGVWQHYKQCRQSAAECYEQAGSWAEAAKDWHDLANRHIDDLSLKTALDVVNRSVQCAFQSQTVDLQAKTLSLKGYILAMLGNHQEGEQIARDAMAMALAENQVEAYAYAYRKLAGTLEYASDFKGSIQAYTTALNFCRSEKLDIQAQFCVNCMCWVLFRLGEWKRCLELCREYTESPDSNETSRALGHLIIGLIRAFRGESRTARHCLDEAYPLLIQSNFYLIEPMLLWGLAVTHEQTEQSDQARHRYTRILDNWKQTREVHDILPCLCSAIAFFQTYGFEEESHRTMQVLSTIANHTGNAEAVATLSFALGETASRQTNYREADEHYTQAVKGFADLSLPLEQALTLYKQGQSRLRAGDRSGATDLLRSALQLAKHLAIRPLAASITECLNQASGNTAPGKPTVPTGLTERQTEILRALVDGLSNKEISVKLNLSTRTIDMHVRHLFDRLNCRTRAEAVRKALEAEFM
ncbi:helix-turn-helix transcriptional regulator [Larkinella sp. VNQ87]|uniref:helix-turn-helix transcriptional regulator n=1 Tax=Larkinella sp. VNQ87 TaxID=3400921 RepID=UPI003C001690